MVHLFKLILGDTLTHGGSTANAAGNHLLQLVDVGGATPLLVLDDVDALLNFWFLNELAVGAHADLAVGAGELVADEGGGVEAGEGDELPAVAEGGETTNVGLLLVSRHGCLPVEGGGEVVSESAKFVLVGLLSYGRCACIERKNKKNVLLLGPHSVHTLGKLLGLLKVGKLALHPDGVAVRGVGDGAVDGAVAAALEAVVALAGAGGVPVEEEVGDAELAGHGAGVEVALALGALEVLLLDGGLVAGQSGGRGVDGGEDGVVEALEVGGGEPLVLNLLELRAELALALGGNHEVVEGLEVGVGGAEDEGVVAGVDVGG